MSEKEALFAHIHRLTTYPGDISNGAMDTVIEFFGSRETGKLSREYYEYVKQQKRLRGQNIRLQDQPTDNQ